MQQADAIMHLRQGNTTMNIIDLHGGPSALAEQLLIGSHTQASPATTSTIILNCSELESMNSRGISQLIRLIIYARHQQQRLLVFGLSEHNRYILEITRLSLFIDIADTETQAVTAAHTT
jgi:anti-anti-sigma factor